MSSTAPPGPVVARPRPGVTTPGPEESVPTRLDETAGRLVAAAAEVFAAKGYDGAGVAEIARRAGMTTGAIYSRFSGKAALLAAAVQSTVPDEVARLFAEHAFDGRATDIFRLAGSHLVSMTPGAHAGLLLEAIVAARRDPEVAAVVRAALVARRQRWAALIESSKARGVLAADVDTEALTHFTHAVGLGFLAYEAVGIPHPDRAPWDHLIDKLVAAVAVAPPGADPAPPSPHPPSPGASHGQ
jgi:TetR/AcrR family transcriptional repressor of uid operon